MAKTTNLPNGTTRYEYDGRHFSSRNKAESAARKDGRGSEYLSRFPIRVETVVGGRWVRS